MHHVLMHRHASPELRGIRETFDAIELAATVDEQTIVEASADSAFWRRSTHLDERAQRRFYVLRATNVG